MFDGIKYIAFDADDTLWSNEHHFREAEAAFFALFADYAPAAELDRLLAKIVIRNLTLYGYGTKGFILSMLEAALEICDGDLEAVKVRQIIKLGKNILNAPIELLSGVEMVLGRLQYDYKLIVATKGDLHEQERKLYQSGLLSYFHHVEIMSEKNPAGYRKMMAHLDIVLSELVMVGNSIKSDIEPVLEVGGYAIYIPAETTWHHEVYDGIFTHGRMREVADIQSILKLFYR